MFYKVILMRLMVAVFSISLLSSCFTTKWYSIEQQPAEPIAYLYAGVFVSNDYVRSASIREIDGKAVDGSTKSKQEISVGTHQVKIYCDEAKGSFDSKELSGQAKLLEFEAQTQRTYKAVCLPFSHWWIEDTESGNIVAGQKPVT